MAEKVARDFRTIVSRPRRFRLRIRHLLLIFCVIFVYLYSSSSTGSLPLLARRSPYRIQAKFPLEASAAKKQRLERRAQVEAAFKHAWKGYKDHAWLHDEVMPVSGGQKDPFVGWAATLVDSLDSLLVMGLEDEFAEALQALEQIDFTKPNADRVPVFEVTIRYLGGLLGAWDVSGGKHPVLLRKARELGDFLTKAFECVLSKSLRCQSIPKPSLLELLVLMCILSSLPTVLSLLCALCMLGDPLQ